MKFLIACAGILLCAGSARAEKKKPYVSASWLSKQENERNAATFSTLGTTVFIDMSGLSFAEGNQSALHDFAAAIKRYSQATRFAASWDTSLFDSHDFERWVYDRNQAAVFHQNSSDGKKGWNGFSVTEPVGVTDEMIRRTAANPNNTVFDLLRYGALNRRVHWKGRWLTLLKTDPRVLSKPRERDLSTDEEKKRAGTTAGF